MITFNPGPSQLSPKILLAIEDIARSGFLSCSHRSQAFEEVSRKAIEGLREKMGLPADYLIFYQSSGTHAMDTLLRNLVLSQSFHFVLGAFSNLFYTMANSQGLKTTALNCPWEKAVPWSTALIPKEIELIAVTHNETSTGSMWPNSVLSQLKEQYPDILIAIDVTSSFGALKMDWEIGDVWFGSVQKCLGLPPGLGFLIISPRAFEKAKHVNKVKGGIAPWQQFEILHQKMMKYQTPETPNLLNIALLARQMEEWNLVENEKEIREKAAFLYQSFLAWKPYVIDKEWQSVTVLNFVVDNPSEWHQKAQKGNIILGEGYDHLKKSCIRIANFPSTNLKDFKTLLDVLNNC